MLPDAPTGISYASVCRPQASAHNGGLGVHPSDPDPRVMADGLIASREAREALAARPAPDFTCECPLGDDEGRRLYRVTGHDGSVSTCAYCQDCAELAAMDWNGETASIVAITGARAAIDATHRFVTAEDDEPTTLADLANLNGWEHDDWRVLTLSRLGLNASADIGDGGAAGSFIVTRVD